MIDAAKLRTLRARLTARKLFVYVSLAITLLAIPLIVIVSRENQDRRSRADTIATVPGSYGYGAFEGGLYSQGELLPSPVPPTAAPSAGETAAVSSPTAFVEAPSPTEEPIIEDSGNLAFGRPSNTSSVWEYSTGYESPKAFDGDPSTRWNAHSGNLNNEWVSVDLGAGTTYNKVVLKEYTVYAHITSYKLQSSNDGTNYTDIAGTSGSSIGDTKTILFSPVTSRYIRLYINTTASNTPTINEMEVYRVTAVAPNLALDRPAQTSSIWEAAGYEASKAFDGDPATRWNSHSGNLNNEWLSVDLGANTAYNKVVLKEYTVYAHITSYKLQSSNDGTNYTDIPGTSGTSIGAEKSIIFSPVTSRYVRLYVNTTASNTPTITEMEVYKVAVAGPNLAFGRPSNTSSVWEYSTGYESPKAFDGDPSTRWNAHSGNLNNEWVSVDLGSGTTYNKVVLKEYTTYAHITSYKLQSSDDGANYTDIPGTSGSSIGDTKTILFSPVTSRYIRLYINTTASNTPTINEMEVY